MTARTPGLSPDSVGLSRLLCETFLSVTIAKIQSKLKRRLRSWWWCMAPGIVHVCMRRRANRGFSFLCMTASGPTWQLSNDDGKLHHSRSSRHLEQHAAECFETSQQYVRCTDRSATNIQLLHDAFTISSNRIRCRAIVKKNTAPYGVLSIHIVR